MTASIAAPNSFTSPTAASAAPAASSANDEDDFTFHDLVNIVNPLQHVPIVATIYRSITGDAIKPLERILGDTLYGGIWGFVSSVANVAFEKATGKDFGETALALVDGDDDNTTAVASNAGTTANATSAAGVESVATTYAEVVSVTAATPASATNVASIALPPPSVATITASTPTTASTIQQQVATAPPTPLQSSSANNAAAAALLAAMNSKGIDPTLSQRALNAYQKSLATSPSASPTTSPAETIPTF